MDKPQEEAPTPPNPGEPRLPEAPKEEPIDDPGGEKTPEQKEIETLHAQKDHHREKREEAEDALGIAEEEARIAKEELVRLKKVNQTSIPSDEELSAKYPDWEFKEPEEKERIRKEEARDKDIAILKENAAWDKDYARVLIKYPQLAENEEEFKAEAYKHPKSHDLEIIAKSFLFDKKTSTPPEPKPNPDLPGLEETPGGSETDLPSNEMTVEDIERLRKENPKKYAELIKSGKLKDISKK